MPLSPTDATSMILVRGGDKRQPNFALPTPARGAFPLPTCRFIAIRLARLLCILNHDRICGCVLWVRGVAHRFQQVATDRHDARGRSRDRRRCSTLPRAGGRLCRLGPAFAQTEDAGTRGTTFARSRPGLTCCLDSIARQSRATRRDEHRAHPVRPPRDRIRLGVDQEWLTHPIPSH